MAQILLHGTLHATIFEATNINNPHRATGKAPKFFRQVVDSGRFKNFSEYVHQRR